MDVKLPVLIEGAKHNGVYRVKIYNGGECDGVEVIDFDSKQEATDWICGSCYRFYRNRVCMAVGLTLK